MDKKDLNKQHKKSEKSQQVIDLEMKLMEMENNWKRALADYKNLEKRTNDERVSLVDYANLTIIQNLLPVLDNFDQLQLHIKDEGLNITIKEFRQLLENAGLQELDIKPGDIFDHTNMDAIDTQEGEKDKVISIIRKGYLFKNKLVRPISVKVGNGLQPNN